MKIYPILLFPLLLLACSQNEIDVYRLDKSRSQKAVSGQLPDGHPPINNQISSPPPQPQNAPIIELSWNLPKGWTQTPGSGMRVATINLDTDLEMSIIRLRGDAGGLVANVNRWRGQLNLGAITEETLKRDIESLKGLLGAVQLVDYTNPDGNRMIAGIISHNGFSWFFKTVGPTKSLETQKKTIRGFLTQVRAKN